MLCLKSTITNNFFKQNVYSAQKFSIFNKPRLKRIQRSIHNYKTFSSILEAHKLAFPHYKRWLDNFSKEEYSAFFNYCYKGDQSINEYLTGKTNFCSKEDALRIETISQSLNKSFVPSNIIVYKGKKISDLNELLESSKENIIGKVIIEKGFMSTSMVESVARRHEKGLLLKIMVPKGAIAGYVGTISEYLEAEILFDKNQKLLIKDVINTENTKILECELIL